MRLHGVILLLALVFGKSYSQELNCQVSVIAPTLQNNPANQEILEGLQSAVFEFVNNTRWTNDAFQDIERIEGNILINISKKTGTDGFMGSIQVSSSRPVFNSNYKSRLLNYNDGNLSFTYQRGAAIVYTPDRHQNNLADVLAYYVYMMIGLDYDSFSLEGGTKYFDKAMQIVSNCQNAAEPGWKPQEGTDNRYWLVTNHTQSLFQPLRTAFYNYHRLGFDKLYADREEGLNQVVESIEALNEIHKARPNSFNVKLFFTAKADELVSLFKGAPPEIRNRMFNTLVKLDPGNIGRYNKMKQGK